MKAWFLELNWSAQSADISHTENLFMNWNANCNLGLHIQHQYLISLMLLWLNEQMIADTIQNLAEILLRSQYKVGTTFGMGCSTSTY